MQCVKLSRSILLMSDIIINLSIIFNVWYYNAIRFLYICMHACPANLYTNTIYRVCMYIANDNVMQDYKDSDKLKCVTIVHICIQSYV